MTPQQVAVQTGKPVVQIFFPSKARPAWGTVSWAMEKTIMVAWRRRHGRVKRAAQGAARRRVRD